MNRLRTFAAAVLRRLSFWLWGHDHDDVGERLFLLSERLRLDAQP